MIDHIEIRACDRCRAKAEVKRDADRIGWGRIAADVFAGNPVSLASMIEGRRIQVAISDREVGESVARKADLCPRCAEELLVWWRQK